MSSSSRLWCEVNPARHRPHHLIFICLSQIIHSNGASYERRSKKKSDKPEGKVSKQRGEKESYTMVFPVVATLSLPCMTPLALISRSARA
jgi:hypothetical protein